MEGTVSEAPRRRQRTVQPTRSRDGRPGRFERPVRGRACATTPQTSTPTSPTARPTIRPPPDASDNRTARHPREGHIVALPSHAPKGTASTWQATSKTAGTRPTPLRPARPTASRPIATARACATAPATSVPTAPRSPRASPTDRSVSLRSGSPTPRRTCRAATTSTRKPPGSLSRPTPRSGSSPTARTCRVRSWPNRDCASTRSRWSVRDCWTRSARSTSANS